jgi:hypothetical protein
LSLAELTKQAQRFETVTLAQDIAILEELRRQARQSNAGRALLDATLVRLALSEQFSSVADLMARVGGAPSIPTQKKKLEPVEGSGFGVQGAVNRIALPLNKPEAEAGGDAPGSSDADSTAPPLPTTEPKSDLGPQSLVLSPSSVPTPAAPMDFDLGDSDDDDSLPAVGKVWEEGPALSMATIMARDKQKAQAAPAQPVAANSNVDSVDPTDLPAVHRAMLALIARQGQKSLEGLLSQGQFAGVEDGRAILRYPKSQETTVRLLDRNGKRKLVVEALSEVLNQPVGVLFEIDPNDDSPSTPPASSAAARPAAPRPTHPAPAPAPESPAAPSIRVTAELRAELEQDPLIRSLIELGGSIVKVE